MEDAKVVELQILEPLSLHNYVINDSLAEVTNVVRMNKSLVEQKNEFDQTALHISCEMGNESITNCLIVNGATIDVQDDEGMTPLIAASKTGSVSCVKLLIDERANLEISDNVGWTALMWACYKGHTEVVTILLCEGANVHVSVAYHMTALLWAAGRGYTRIVRLLCEKGAKVNVTDKFGSTPMMWACRRGFIDVVSILLDFKADGDAVGAEGANALLAATKNNHMNCVRILLERTKVNINHTDKNNSSALSYAAKLGMHEAIALFLNCGAYLNLVDRNGDTPLIKAVKHSHTEAVRALLSRYADVDIRGRNDKTALHWACELGHVSIVQELLACNADTEAVSEEGDTPLLRAVKNKNVTIARYLLDKGASVTATDTKGETSLHIAIRARSLRLVKLLLKNPRDSRLLYQPNKTGETPYNLDAAHNKSILANVFGAKNMSPENAMHEVTGEGIPQSYDLYSSALADILCEPTLTPPLTVGLYAKWGSGKSFLLNKLQEQMKVFTSANHINVFKPSVVSFTVVLLISIFFGLVTAFLTTDPDFRLVSGLVFGCSLFLIYAMLISIVAVGIAVGNWQWAFKVGSFIARQEKYIFLLSKLWFLHSPLPRQPENGQAIPVRFLFTNYSRLTSVGGETSLAEMIGLLSVSAEKNLGYLAVRLYRAFRTSAREKSKTPRHRLICCVPTFIIAICFLVTLAAIILLSAAAYGPSPSLINMMRVNDTVVMENTTANAVNAALFSFGAILVAILILFTPTLIGICGALLRSQRKRVLSAAHHTKSEERLMQQLKHEVDLLCETVIAIDAFTVTQTRMCVIINGLDSCEQDKVLHVLDTVHILFSQQPYITVLAIDPLIISKAIDNNLKSVFRDANINGHDYLKNIVHLPFYLKDKSQNLPQKSRSIADREDGLSEDETDQEYSTVIVETRKTSYLGRNSSSANRGRVGGSRRNQRTMDLSRLMFSEDWFNSVSPQLMKRILNIVSLTGRLLRAEGIDFSWGRLAAWINLTEQWPYRASFLIHSLERSDSKVPGSEFLKNVFDKNRHLLYQNDPMLAIDTSDERSYQIFLSSHSLTVRDLRNFLPSTVNLDPKVKELIAQEPYQLLQSENTLGRKMVQDAGLYHRLSMSHSVESQNIRPSQSPVFRRCNSMFSSLSGVNAAFHEWSVDEVSRHLRELKGVAQTNFDRYDDFVREHNINGTVLASCDLDDLKKELFAPFGDWTLIKQWILRLRACCATEDRSDSSSPPLPSILQGHTPQQIRKNVSFSDREDFGHLYSPPLHRNGSIVATENNVDSLEFTSLHRKDRLAYNQAFKEYLKLQPTSSTNISGTSNHQEPISPHKPTPEDVTNANDIKGLRNDTQKLLDEEQPRARFILKDDTSTTDCSIDADDVLNGNENIISKVNTGVTVFDRNDNQETTPLLIINDNNNNNSNE